MKTQDIVIGGMLFAVGAIFFARMRQRKEEAKWKYYLAFFVMMCGAATAVWDVFFKSAG
jgi:hypothetical protein